MGISENFLVNTESFDPIIKALAERSEQPEVITDQLLEEMGYNNPSDLLVMHVLRGLEIIDDEKKPTDLYIKMVDPETTKEAIAEGVIQGYGELFEHEPNIHRFQSDDLRGELKTYFGDKKTDLIIKYIANTFQKLVTYAGISKIEKARDTYLEGKSIRLEDVADTEATEEQQEYTEPEKADIADTISQDSVKSRSVEEILFGDAPTENTETAEEDVEKEEQSPQETAENTEETVSQAESESEDEAVSEDVSQTGDIAEDEDMEEQETGMETEPDTVIEKEPDTTEETFESDIHEYRPGEEDIKEEAGIEETNTAPAPSEEDSAPAPSPELDLSGRRVQKAIIRRANLQYKLEYYPEALKSVEAILTYFEDADEVFLKEAVKTAVIRRVEILNKLDREDQLLPALNEVISRFKDSSNKDYYHHASMAMLQKAELLEQSDFDREDLLPLYDTIIERLEANSDPVIENKVTGIFAKRLELLEQSGGRMEFLDALGTSIVRFKEAKRYRKYLEDAMFRKAELLEKMERNEEALDAYNAFLEEFGQVIEI